MTHTFMTKLRKSIAYIQLLTCAISLLFPMIGQGTETCGRIAEVNYQNILVDTSSSLRGEGLRPYLNKDPKALEYLNTYQENSKPGLRSSLLGTLGVTFAILSFTTNNEHSAPYNRKVLLTTGLSLILVNFIFNKAVQAQNEKNLQLSINEYNQRNSPKIYFGPALENENNSKPEGFELGVSKEF